jgi:hypothetical protein
MDIIIIIIIIIMIRYCECFASGEYCDGCHCHACQNTEREEEARLKAIQVTLSKNPDAFRPKLATANLMGVLSVSGDGTALNDSRWLSMMQQLLIKRSGQDDVVAAVSSEESPDSHMHKVSEGGEGSSTTDIPPVTKHFKGCNCRRSYCLKKYCECFQAGILCTTDCHCVDCKNIEGKRDDILHLVDSLKTFSPLQSPAKRARASEFSLGTLDKVSFSIITMNNYIKEEKKDIETIR